VGKITHLGSVTVGLANLQADPCAGCRGFFFSEKAKLVIGIFLPVAALVNVPIIFIKVFSFCFLNVLAANNFCL